MGGLAARVEDDGRSREIRNQFSLGRTSGRTRKGRKRRSSSVPRLSAVMSADRTFRILGSSRVCAENVVLEHHRGQSPPPIVCVMESTPASVPFCFRASRDALKSSPVSTLERILLQRESGLRTRTAFFPAAVSLYRQKDNLQKLWAPCAVGTGAVLLKGLCIAPRAV